MSQLYAQQWKQRLEEFQACYAVYNCLLFFLETHTKGQDMFFYFYFLRNKQLLDDVECESLFFGLRV